MASKYFAQPCPTCGHDRQRLNGAWLREQRELAGLSLDEAADCFMSSKSFLSQVERGEKGCSQWLQTAYENLKAPARDAPTSR